MAEKKHPLPTFLVGRVDAAAYERWLTRKAAAHLRRDRKRGFEGIWGAAYRDAIHEAVVHSKGRDAYTGEMLHWHLLSKYDNEESEAGQHQYKARFALLPTVDHISSSAKTSGFCICAWRTNDAKHDLSYAEFIQVCARVLRHAGYSVTKEA